MPTEKQVSDLADAMWHLLDDMGLDGQSVCLAAKAKARIAFEPFLQADLAAEPDLGPDYAPDFPLHEAERVAAQR